jgi:hypothetical protein
MCEKIYTQKQFQADCTLHDHEESEIEEECDTEEVDENSDLEVENPMDEQLENLKFEIRTNLLGHTYISDELRARYLIVEHILNTFELSVSEKKEEIRNILSEEDTMVYFRSLAKKNGLDLDFDNYDEKLPFVDDAVMEDEEEEDEEDDEEEEDEEEEDEEEEVYEQFKFDLFNKTEFNASLDFIGTLNKLKIN